MKQLRLLRASFMQCAAVLCFACLCLLLWCHTKSEERLLSTGRSHKSASWRIESTSSPHGTPRYNFRQKELGVLLDSRCNFSLPVPNIVHYVLLNKTEIKIYEYISIISANSFLKPCFILIHGDMLPTGKWWDKLVLNVTNIVYVYREAPTSIFGHPINIVEHKTDVLRLEVILEYGGIYLDSDVYVLRSFDPLRIYNVTLGREMDNSVANGIILSNRKSAFIQIWYLSYHRFNDTKWADNSVFMGDRLWKLFPELVHVEFDSMIMLKETEFSSAVDNKYVDWNPKRYSVHLYARFLHLKHDFDIENLKVLNTTFGALSRFILFGSRSLIAPDYASVQYN